MMLTDEERALFQEFRTTAETVLLHPHDEERLAELVIRPLVARARAEGAAEEREICARIAYRIQLEGEEPSIANAIRARGEGKP